MKRLIILFASIVLNAYLFAQSRIVFSQDFESDTLQIRTTPPGYDKTDRVGGITLEQFGYAESQWSPELDATYPIAGKRSLRVDVISTGNAALQTSGWGLQLRIISKGYWQAKKDMSYKLTYKMSTSVPTVVEMHLLNGTGLYESINLSFAGNDVTETFTYTSDVLKADDLDGTRFEWFWGPPSLPCTFYIDDIKIEEIGDFTAVNELKAKPINAYSNNGLLHIESEEDCNVEVLTLVGQKIATKQIFANEKQAISLPLSSGCVIVKNTDLQGRINTQKVILK